jgi:hypothetical protein
MLELISSICSRDTATHEALLLSDVRTYPVAHAGGARSECAVAES